LQIQVLYPEFNKNYKEVRGAIPELKRDGNNLITIWSGKDDVWDWTQSTIIWLINPQGHRITKVKLPTKLTPDKEGDKETTKTSDTIKSSQNCLIM